MFIITDTRKDSGRTWYVAARPGFYRCADGTQKRDGCCPLTSGPEWTLAREHAFLFATHRSAARVASRTPGSRIEEISLWEATMKPVYTNP